MKIVRTVNLCVLLAALIASPSCKKTQRPENGVLNAAIQSSPATLDPRLATDAEGDKISQLIFDGLMARNDDLEIVPDLAERFEKISDTSYRFFLRRGVLFHSGNPLTSRDVVYTYETILDGTVASPFKEYFSRIRKIVSEDDYTVRIDLAEPYAPFLTLLTKGIVSEADAKKLGGRYGREPVGTGPYRLVRFVPEKIVELEANSGYFGKIPKIKTLRLHVISDDNIRVLKLIKGDIDLVQNGVPALLLKKVLENSGLEMIADDGIVVTYLGMNLTDKYLKDRRVRQAIAYAIDRDQIIAHRYGGMAEKANSILSPMNWAYDADLYQYDYDPKKAASLLEEADLKKPTLSYKTSTIKERIDTGRMIAHQLGQAGITVKVEPYEWGTFYRDVRTGNFQLYSLSWVGVTEPDIFYDVCHSSRFPPRGLNRDRYKNPEVDRLVGEARVTMDQNERKKIYSKVQKIILDDLPFVPLWYEKNIVVYQKSLEDVSVRPDASYLTFVNITKE